MPAPIDEFSSQVGDFDRDDLAGLARPLVIRGACNDWPLVRAGRESDSAFAHQLSSLDNGSAVDTLLMPPQEAGVIGYNAHLDGFNYRHFRVSVTEVLQRLAAYSRHPGVTPGVALQSALIPDCLPAFQQAHPMPLLASGILPRLWIGNQVTTPTHFDASHNLAVVVCGRRRFTLFAPEQVGNLYIGPLDFAPTGAAISMARLDQADDPRFPRLRVALEHSLTAELVPGDALYIPPLWWHHVASVQPLNALVNYWWKEPTTDGRIAESGMGALTHALLAFKSLAPTERAAWKTLLDHYVFNHEDPAAHIPVERRGVLGPLTPELVEQARHKIRQFL